MLSRRGRRLRGGATLLVAIVCSAVGVRAFAGDRDEDLFIRPEDQRTVLFASVDAGRSVFLSAGSKQTLVGSLDRDGYVAVESSGFGLTRERSKDGLDLPILRFKTETSAMFGRQWNMQGLYLAAYLGPELEHEQLTVAGRILSFSKPRYGAKAQFELWSNPTSDTLVTATVVAGTARESLWARASAGYRVFRNAYVGPEATTYVTDSYRELKVGAHLTGFAVGIVQARVSAGWMVADDHKAGTPYVGVTAWIRM